MQGVLAIQAPAGLAWLTFGPLLMIALGWPAAFVLRRCLKVMALGSAVLGLTALLPAGLWMTAAALGLAHTAMMALFVVDGRRHGIAPMKLVLLWLLGLDGAFLVIAGGLLCPLRLRLLPPNPVAMAGRIERCWLIVYRAPLDQVQARLPEGFEAVEHAGFGFFHLVVCAISGMRPAGLPSWCGFGYRHAAVRILCRVRLEDGSAQAGLHFLRSDCDAPPAMPLARLGNWVTDFRFHPARISLTAEGSATRIEVAGSSPAAWTLDPQAPLRNRDRSPFRCVEEAVRFLKYPAHALSPAGPGRVHVLSITRDEAAWRSRPVGVLEERIDFLRGTGAELEMAFEVDPIDYVWNRGKRKQLNRR
jgi:hypothetical protein